MIPDSHRPALSKIRKFRIDPALDARLESVSRANRCGASTVIRAAIMNLIAADLVDEKTIESTPGSMDQR